MFPKTTRDGAMLSDQYCSTFCDEVGQTSEMSKEMSEKASVTLPGVVNKIIPAIFPEQSEMAQITVESDHHLYRDVRIENTLTDDTGGKVSLKVGSPVELTITAEAGSTTVESSPQPSGENLL